MCVRDFELSALAVRTYSFAQWKVLHCILRCLGTIGCYSVLMGIHRIPMIDEGKEDADEGEGGLYVMHCILNIGVLLSKLASFHCFELLMLNKTMQRQ